MFNKLEEYLNVFTGNILHNSRKQLRSVFSLCNHLKKKEETNLSNVTIYFIRTWFGFSGFITDLYFKSHFYEIEDKDMGFC